MNGNTLARRACALVAVCATQIAVASGTPSSVTVAGSLQSELGCPGDWQPECSLTQLGYDANDDVWQRAFASLPAGSYEYKVALDGSWTVNYGRYATENGANVPVSSGTDTSIKFYYDDKTHWITDNVRTLIATAPGSFQSELGCAGDWDPGCLRSWLQDPDEDGTYTLEVKLPAGSYETKVAINETWDVNYGAGGVLNGPNIAFTSDGLTCTRFSFVGSAKVMTVSEVECPTLSVTIAGSLQSELGCAGDWDPACTATRLVHDANDDVWQFRFSTLPAGSYEYKAAVNGSWDVNYGRYATLNGANIPVALSSTGPIKFYYDVKTHWVTDDVSELIATAPGSFQSELGCAGDWDPGCLRSWLQDPDGDGTYFFKALIPSGSYETKVAIDETWDVNYGAGGVQNGPNIAFTSDGATCTGFTFVGATKVMTVRPIACDATSVQQLLAALQINVTGVGPGTSLRSKVILAQTYFAAGDLQAMCSTLRDVLGVLRAQRGKKIPVATADALIRDVQAIMAAVGCS
jgi:pullulanase